MTTPRGGRLTPREALAILGLGPSPGRGEVVRAYRRLLRAAHPDTADPHRPAGPPLEQVIAAYQVLTHEPDRQPTTQADQRQQQPGRRPAPGPGIEIPVRRAGPTGQPAATPTAPIVAGPVHYRPKKPRD